MNSGLVRMRDQSADFIIFIYIAVIFYPSIFAIYVRENLFKKVYLISFFLSLSLSFVSILNMKFTLSLYKTSETFFCCLQVKSIDVFMLDV